MHTPNKITDQMMLDNGCVQSRLTVLNLTLTYGTYIYIVKEVSFLQQFNKYKPKYETKQAKKTMTRHIIIMNIHRAIDQAKKSKNGNR